MSELRSNRNEINAGVSRNARRALDAAAIYMQAQTKKALSKRGSNRTGPGGASPPGKSPAVGTGALRRSIQVDSSGNKGANPSVKWGTNLIYARIQEFGGRIGGKGKKLTIPIHPDAKRRSAAGRGARSFQDLFVIQRNGRAPLLVRKGKGGRSIDIMYVLASSVNLPARPYMRPTLKREKKRLLGILAKIHKLPTTPSGAGPSVSNLGGRIE